MNLKFQAYLNNNSNKNNQKWREVERKREKKRETLNYDQE